MTYTNNSMENGFNFRLANGLEWNFSSTRTTLDLVTKASTIMGFEPGISNQGTNIFFVSNDIYSMLSGHFDITSYPELKGYPVTGWVPKKFVHINFWTHTDVPVIIGEINGERSENLDIYQLSYSLYPVFKQAIASGGFPLHAGFVEYDGKGVLIAAKSGTGKSTCCRRIPSPWNAVCDDEVLVIPTDHGYQVHPLPTWSEYTMKRSQKTWNILRHLPLSAIFFLEQSPIDGVSPVSKSKASCLLYEHTLHPCTRFNLYLQNDEIRATNAKLFENLCRISSDVPAYTLRASLTGRFWEEMEKVLS